MFARLFFLALLLTTILTHANPTENYIENYIDLLDPPPETSPDPDFQKTLAAFQDIAKQIGNEEISFTLRSASHKKLDDPFDNPSPGVVNCITAIPKAPEREDCVSMGLRNPVDKDLFLKKGWCAVIQHRSCLSYVCSTNCENAEFGSAKWLLSSEEVRNQCVLGYQMAGYRFVEAGASKLLVGHEHPNVYAVPRLYPC